MKTHFSKKILFYCSLAILAIFTSCESSKDEPNLRKGNILICSLLPNPDGKTGASFIQTIDNLNPKKYSNDKAFSVPFSTQPIIIGNEAYVLPGLGATDDMVKYELGADKGLKKEGTLTLPVNSAGVSIVKASDEKAYVSLVFSPKLIIINPKTMKILGNIDISKYAVGDKVPNASGMIIRDGKLFVTLYQMVGGFYQKQDRPYADVLIIDTKTDKPIKMITEKKTGLSSPCGPARASHQIFMDENKDIYIVCMGAFGEYKNHKAGILRIKNGETEFDESYNLIVNGSVVEGESSSPNYFMDFCYAKDGIAYAFANFPKYQSKPKNYITDRPCLPVIIDLKNKKLKLIGKQRSNGYNSIAKINGKIVFGMSTDRSSGFFIYDEKKNKMSDEAIIKIDGKPFMIGQFKK